MTISIEMAGLVLTMMLEAGAFIWWAATLTSRVNHLEKAVDAVAEEGVPSRLAKLEQAMHDLRNGLQRIENRLPLPIAAAE